MALKSSGSLTVAFGMVSIPVKLYTATVDQRISFNMIDPKTLSRVKSKYYAESTGDPVERADCLKGYEYSKGQYVTFKPEEIKALEEEATHTAEITEFVPAESIDPVFFDKSYYLAPAPGGAKPYALLLTAMRRAERVAIGKWAVRGKGYIVMIRPTEEGEDALVMQTLLFADEVKPASEVDVPKAEIKEGELELAKKLIESFEADAFDPARYKDEFRARVESLIEKKISGQEVVIAEVSKPKAPVVDLMAALSASLKDKPAKAKTEKKATTKKGKIAA